MAQIVQNPLHKIIAKRGATIWMPRSCVAASLADPDIYAQSASQLYPLGSKLEFADGRVFRYARFGETSTVPPSARMVCNASLCPGATGGATYGYEGTLDATSDYAVGSTILIMNDTTDRVKNFYEDGMLAVYPSGHYVEYRIAGSDAATTVDDVTIYLDDPNGLQTALVVASTGITAYPSIYYRAEYMPATAFEAAIGVVLCNTMTSGYYAWIQRKGRCIITPTAYFGDTADERMAQLHSDGCIALKAGHGTMTVGYLTQRTQADYGDLEVWLMLE